MTTFGQNVGKWKDVEKVFGVFQVQWVIIQDPYNCGTRPYVTKREGRELKRELCRNT
jgi:hypothetical protein